jgi:hypothetical protein
LRVACSSIGLSWNTPCIQKAARTRHRAARPLNYGRDNEKTTESICGADFQDRNCRVHVEQQKLRDPLNNFGSTGQDRQLPDVDRHRVVGHYIFLRCARMRARFLIFSLLSLAAVTERPHGRNGRTRATISYAIDGSGAK